MIVFRRMAVMAAALAVCCAFAHAQAPKAAPTSGTVGTPPQKVQPGEPQAPKAAAASEVRTLRIAVPASGEYQVRVLPVSASDTPSLPQAFSGREGAITLGAPVRGQRVAVTDRKSGTTAIAPVPTDGPLTLRPVQFDRIRSVEVSVTREGLPVQAAVVTLDAGTLHASIAVDATMAGVARFGDVPIGRASITAAYGSRFTEKRETDLNPPVGGGPLRVQIAATNEVATLPAANQPGAPAAAPSAAPKPASTPEPQPARERNAGGAIPWLSEALGLALAGAVILMLYRWAISGGLAAALKKAGIQVQPEPPPAAGTPWAPAGAPAPVVADPALCPFCGQRRDAAGACACTVAGGPAGATPAAPGAGAQRPRLVGTAGTYAHATFELPGAGPVTIGREPTNPVALPDDGTVSRRHATIAAQSGGFTITDEGSANGVYVNGVRVASQCPLNPGDEVQVGNTRFRFEV